MTFIFWQEAWPSAEKWTSFFVTEKKRRFEEGEHHEKRRTGPHPVRMRDLRCDLPGGTPDDGREDRGEHDPHA